MRHDGIDPQPDKLVRESGKTIVISPGELIVHSDVFSFLVPELAQAREQGLDLACVPRVRGHAQVADAVHLRRPLCSQGQRQRHKAAEEEHELPPPYVRHCRPPVRSVCQGTSRVPSISVKLVASTGFLLLLRWQTCDGSVRLYEYTV